MLRRKAGKIEWLEFELLQEFPLLKHGVFLRHGGVSKGPFASLNAGGNKNDTYACRKKNQELIRQVLGVDSLHLCEQIHADQVAFLPESSVEELKKSDGMITNQPQKGLLVRHADCQGAFFYDPLTNTIAAVHCGWRGNVLNIYAATVKKMRETVGAQPRNIRVCISPSLGPERSEFINYPTELPEPLWKYQFRPNYFNLWEISRQQLLEAGILPEHMQLAEICTYDNPDDYYSFRRDKRVTGAHGSVISLI